MIEISCPNCQRTYKLPDEFLGRKVVCKSPECQTKFVASELAEVIDPDDSSTTKRLPTLYVALGSMFCGVAIAVVAWSLMPTPKNDLVVDARSSQSQPDQPDQLEMKAFRSAVTKTVLFTNIVVSRFQKHAAVNDWMMDALAKNSMMNLDAQRSRIPVPPRSLESRELIQQQLDSLVEDMKEICRHFRPVRPSRNFPTADAALKAIYSGELQLPVEVQSRLAAMKKTAMTITDELKIPYAEAHGADRFAKQADEFIAEARQLIDKFEGLNWHALSLIASQFEFTEKWSFMVEPPQKLAEGPAIAKDFADAFRSLIKAREIAECARHFSTSSDSSELSVLHQAFDKELAAAKSRLTDAKSKLASAPRN